MTCAEGNGQAQSIAEAIARRSYGKLVAFLAARTRDVAAAEDALSEAFAAALTDWPVRGCPDNPEAWLLTVARRKAIDAHRVQHREVPAADLFPDNSSLAEAFADAASPIPEIPDLRLALMFVCAHPAIDPAIRAPLILQSVLGLDAARIASAFLTSPAAMSKRLVRAKEKIRDAAIPFDIPGRDEIPARLTAVLDAIYAAFTEGWPDPAATDSIRRDLTAEALFLAQLLHSLLPAEPESAGLLALMLYVDARRNARRSPSGDYIPLAQQNPMLWDTEKVIEAEALLRNAGFHVKASSHIGRYQLEAALQSAHIARRLTGHDNWPAIVQLYDALFTLTQSPIVAINRALAVAETDGPAAALASLDLLEDDPRLAQYQPWWATRADLLARTGETIAAHHAYDIAIGLESDPAVRRFLQLRQVSLSNL